MARAERCLPIPWTCYNDDCLSPSPLPVLIIHLPTGTRVQEQSITPVSGETFLSSTHQLFVVVRVICPLLLGFGLAHLYTSLASLSHSSYVTLRAIWTASSRASACTIIMYPRHHFRNLRIVADQHCCKSPGVYLSAIYHSPCIIAESLLTTPFCFVQRLTTPRFRTPTTPGLSNISNIVGS